MKRLLITFLLILIPLQLGFLYLKTPLESSGAVAGIEKRYSPAGIENSVSIGDFRFSLFGYTSPRAFVTFEGMGIFDQTTADNTGYFEFNNRFSPFSKREACLIAKDQLGRLSAPTCLPPFPVNYNVSIGPVIMPPTVSLDKSDYFMGDQVMLSGQAVPNTEVKLSMFGDGNNKLARNMFRISDFTLIKPVEAFTFPELSTQSDEKGNYSVNLPSSTPEKFRLFTQTNYKKSISSNSNKLNLEILPVWMVIIKFFLFLFSLIKPRLLEIVIILEIIYILYILKSHFFDEKAIVPYQSHLPVVEEHNLPMIEKHNLPTKIL